MIRDRILQWLGIPTEPQTVERAPRRERWKRALWMHGSLWLAGAVTIAVGWGVETTTGLVSATRGHIGLTPLLPVFAAIVLFVVINIVLWRWGFEQFDLVPPWQFREDWDAREQEEVSEA